MNYNTKHKNYYYENNNEGINGISSMFLNIKFCSPCSIKFMTCEIGGLDVLKTRVTEATGCVDVFISPIFVNIRGEERKTKSEVTWSDIWIMPQSVINTSLLQMNFMNEFYNYRLFK